MIDPLEELESLLQYAPEVADRLAFGDALTHAQQQIAERAALPGSVELCACVLGQLTPLPAADAELVRQNTFGLMGAITELEGVQEGEGLREIQHALRSASRSLTALQAVLVKSWKDLVKAEFGSLTIIAGVLERIDNTRTFGHELHAWASKVASSTSAAWFPTLADVTQLAAMRTERPSMLAGLKRAGIDAEVHSFLHAVAEGKATLASVDVNVLKWLTEQGASNRFAVNAIAPNPTPAQRRNVRV